PPQDGRAYAAHAEGEPEEQPCNEPDLSRYQFLGIDQNGGEGGGQDDADKDREDARPEQVGGVWQRQRKGATPRIENQITYLRPKRSPTGPPIIVPAATAKRKRKSINCDVSSVVWNLSMRKNI